MTTPAAKLERYLEAAARKVGGRTRKYTSPGHRGVPDRLVFLPGGRLILCEIKAPGDRLRALQKHEIRLMRSLGFQVEIITSEEDIDRCLS